VEERKTRGAKTFSGLARPLTSAYVYSRVRKILVPLVPQEQYLLDNKKLLITIFRIYT